MTTARPLLVASAVAALLGSSMSAAAQTGWTQPVPLATAASLPEVGIDAAGNAVAVWQEGFTMWAASFAAAGGAWSPAAQISPQGDNVRSLSFAMNAAGHGVAVWTNRGPSNTAMTIQSAFFSTQTMQWSAPQNVSTDGALSASVGMDDAGNAIAVWERQIGHNSLTVSHYNATANTWGSISEVAFYLSTNAWRLAVAPSGDAALLLMDISLNGGVRAIRYRASTSIWQPSEPLSAVSSSGYSDPALAAGAGGRFVAVWNRFASGASHLESAVFNPVTGGWSAALTVGSELLRGSVAVNATDALLLGYNPATRMFRTARLALAQQTWGPLTDLATGGPTRPTTGPGSFAQSAVQIAANGRALGVWEAQDDDVNYVRASAYDSSSGTWGEAVDLSNQRSSGPGLAISTAGHGIASWVDRPAGGTATSRVARFIPGSTSPVLAPATVNRPNVTLSWTAPTAGPAPSGYAVVASLSPGGPVIASLPVGTQLSLSVSAPDGTYFVRVLADVNGAPMSSNEIRVDLGVPDVPRNLTATVAGSVITFAWHPPLHTGGSAIGTYVLEAGTGPGLSDLASMPVGDRTSFVTPPVPDFTYYVRLRARNGAGMSLPTSDIRVTVGPPPPGPPVLSGTSGPGGSVSLSWSAPQSGAPATGYQLRAGTQPGTSSVAVLTLPPSASSFTAAGVPSGTYFVRVAATSLVGLGELSNEITITVP